MDRRGIVLLQQRAGLRAPGFAAPCACVCIAGTPERQALGAAPASVNQKERKKNIDGVLGKGLLQSLRLTICTRRPLFLGTPF